MPTTKSEQETQQLGSKIAQENKNGGLICLFGDLGSGKTTFTKGFAKEIGIDNFAVKSPTYTYIRRYSDNLYHIDLYRIEEVDELLSEEIKEILENKENIVVIEWAEKIIDELPEDRTELRFKFIDTNTREIKVK